MLAILRGLKPRFPGRQPSVISIYHRTINWLPMQVTIRLFRIASAVCYPLSLMARISLGTLVFYMARTLRPYQYTLFYWFSRIEPNVV